MNLQPVVNEDMLKNAVDAVFEACSKSKKPLILAGIELNRQNATEAFSQLLTCWSKVNPNLRVASNLFAKTQIGIDETNPLFIGVLDGKLATSEAEKALKESDYLLQIGTILTDIELAGSDLSQLLGSMNYFAACKQTVVSRDHFLATGVPLRKLIEGLIGKFNEHQASLRLTTNIESWNLPAPFQYLHNHDSDKLSYDTFTIELSHFLSKFAKAGVNTRLIVDSSLALFPASHLKLARDQFYCETVWGSIGFSVGAGIGIKFAHPNDRVIVVVGDGGLQNNPGSLSTIARRKQNTIVFVIQNELYAIDQWLVDPKVFSNHTAQLPAINVLPSWNFKVTTRPNGGQQL